MIREINGGCDLGPQSFNRLNPKAESSFKFCFYFSAEPEPIDPRMESIALRTVL
jgi:hypothetical protein